MTQRNVTHIRDKWAPFLSPAGFRHHTGAQRARLISLAALGCYLDETGETHAAQRVHAELIHA